MKDYISSQPPIDKKKLKGVAKSPHPYPYKNYLLKKN